MLLFLIFFFVPLALTAPLSPSTIIGNWTLSSFSRSCSPVDNMCNYGFDLIEGRDIERDSWVCFLTANGTSQSSFSNAQCFGFGDRFLVNGGWSGAGKTAFMTLVVTDQAARGYAFFGIAEGDFDDGLFPSPPFPLCHSQDGEDDGEEAEPVETSRYRRA